MVLTVETHSSIKGNKRPCSVVVPSERVLCTNTAQLDASIWVLQRTSVL